MTPAQKRGPALRPVERFTVPENLIPLGCETITPDMLTLAQLESGQIDRIVQAVPGGTRNIQDIYPLTPAQEGILFHYMLGNRRDVYLSGTILEFQTRERLDGFIDALRWVIDRHEMLRSAVLWEDLPRPLHVVHRHASLPVETTVLDGNRDAAEQAKEWINAKQWRIDLRKAPLMQLRVAADPHSPRWYAVLQHHHMVSDHESFAMMCAELTACLEGRAHQLPQPLPYRSHVARTLAFSRTNDAEDFFHSRLHDIDEPTMPFGVQDVHGDGSQIDEARQALPPALAQRMRVQARRYRISVATLFHAAWGLVVAQTARRESVVYGTVLFGRLQASARSRQRFGMFLNTLPLRVDLQDVTSGELVERTQRELYGLLSYEQVSSAVAQRCSGIGSSAPLFTALLNYRHTPVSLESWGWAGIPGVRELAGVDKSSYPITLAVDDLGEGFELTSQTDRRIDPRRVMGYMTTVIESLVDALERAPQTPALSLPILPESERHQVLELFNATRVAWPQEKLIHELFEEQVRRMPAAVAAVYEETSLTYAELNAKANQLAWYLRERGIGPDERVGLCVERGLEMVVGLLGVLKAGGAYVPLDPSYPPERLRYMLADAAPRVLLIQGRLREALSQTPAEVIALDECWSEIGRGPINNLNVDALGLKHHHLAYVIYTSGSTGRPKGVMVEHAGLSNYLQWALCAYRPEDGDAVPVSSSLAFDATVTSLYCPLLSGRSMVLIPSGHELEGLERLLQQPKQWGLVKISPAHLHALGQRLKPVKLPCTVGAFVIGGEALPSATVELWRSMWPQARLINEYGPTETVVGCCVYDIPQDWVPASSVPIGRPIPNAPMYILDSRRQPVPIGVIGDIYIGGAGVARGYLNQPELTAERFVKDPFSGDPSARMYKTGDLGRWRTDGNIEYLGRNDNQVKLRGFRIELGEIEAQLLKHRQVKEAVVLAREDEMGEKRLVAYVVGQDASDSGNALSVETLRAHLKLVLPDYMLPSAFVMLENLPLTANGKLDRRALPAPERSAYGSRDYEAPRGEIEEILAGIWQALLHVERVGRYDNFFELGGHSLLIVQMLERLRRVGLTAEVRRVFDSPTLAHLASAMGSMTDQQFVVPPNLIPPGCEAITPRMLTLVDLEAEHIERIVQAVPGGAANIQDIYPLVALQEGLLFHHMLDTQRADTYLLKWLLCASSQEKLEKLIATLQAMIDHHDVLRTAVLWEQLPQPVQVVWRRALLPMEEVVLEPERDPIEQLRERMWQDGQRLDLRRAPLLRLQVAADPHSERRYVLMQLHQIICDHEMTAAFGAETIARFEGREQAPTQEVPYRNHVAQALVHARTHDADAFFHTKLGDVREPTAPFGLLDVHGDASRVGTAGHAVQPDISRRLRAQARRLAVSAATLFHAACGLVVARTSGRDDVVFGTVLLGRLQSTVGAQRTLGIFINTLPLRLSLQEMTATELVELTQRELVELLNYEQSPLALAQRCSGVVGSTPLFSTLLNYRHSTPGQDEGWSRTSGIEVLEGEERTNYPITISVDDQGEGFIVTAQTDSRIDPQRMVQYVCTAVCSLVEALEEAPRIPALSLSILPESERQQVLELFNATQAAYPQEKLIHELFEEQVRRTPAAVAVIYGQTSLTYAQLNAKANQLAWYLRGRGIEPDQRVGLCVERGLDMVVGLLGILKAGGAYVPMDPRYPPERLEYILRDAAPRVLVMQESLGTQWAESVSDVIALDGDWNEISRQPSSDPPVDPLKLHSHHLAYVIYTSGSTGRPKGVMVEHSGVVNFLTSMQRHPGISPSDCMLSVTTVSFDIAALEIYLPLITGAKLALASREATADAHALTALIDDLNVTVMQGTPATWRLLLGAGWQGRSNLKVLCGGEALSTPLASALFSCVGELWNLYGPTETTIWSCCRQIAAFPSPHDSVESIGRPIANTVVYILDTGGQPVPTGVAGEIHIGGAGVARGYLNRSELTAERFIKDPFSANPNTLLYKTGDLGRWRADGNIEYLGRNDTQVKIRGFRIELGEIEARLLQHPQVKEAVVVAREDEQSEKRLVAYVVGKPVNDPLQNSFAKLIPPLGEYLRTRLPDYMIPSAWLVLEQLPLTPNGKLDRHALPAPKGWTGQMGEYVAPRTELEHTLAEIWTQVLGVNRVGVHDNFFELGGHSLLGMKLISKLASRLAFQAPVATIFKYPTIAEMARLVEDLLLRDSQVPLGAEINEPVQDWQEEGIV
jgi:amino acid adenylation domain-containing protein